MIIPAGHSHVVIEFSGVYVPHGAAITFGVDNTAADDPLTIANDVAASLSTSNIMDYLTDGVAAVAVNVKNGPNATGAQGELGISQPGGIGTAGAAPNLCYLISKGTALGGRKGRGRWYLPGVAESAVDGAGVISSGVVSNLNTAVEDFAAALALAGHELELLHTDATAPTTITSLVCSSVAATQRRRMRR